MKKSIFIILIGLIAVFNSIADTKQLELNKTQEKEFNRSRLVVETSTSSVGHVNYDTGLMMSSTVRQWQGYEGFMKVDEARFFAIAGYEEESAQAAKYHNTNNALIISGTIGMVIGFGMMFIPLLDDTSYKDLNYDEIRERNRTLLWSGCSVGIVAAVPFSYGCGRALENWAPTSLAFSVADEYNANVLKKILNNK